MLRIGQVGRNVGQELVGDAAGGHEAIFRAHGGVGIPSVGCQLGQCIHVWILTIGRGLPVGVHAMEPLAPAN